MAVEYLPLASSPEERESEYARRVDREPARIGSDRLLLASLAAALLSSTLSLLFILRPSATPPPTSPALPQLTLRANSYMHFDRFIPAIAAAAPTLHSFPPVSLHMRTHDAQRRTWEDDRGHDTVYGWVYPDARRVLVNESVATVLQFRHRDYGLTRCALRFKPPRAFKGFDPAAAFAQGKQKMDAWLLEPSGEFSPHGDVWERAPERVRLLASLEMDVDVEESGGEAFECVQGGWTAVELVCADAEFGCAVDFWQQEGPVLGGVYLEQTVAI